MSSLYQVAMPSANPRVVSRHCVSFNLSFCFSSCMSPLCLDLYFVIVPCLVCSRCACHHVTIEFRLICRYYVSSCLLSLCFALYVVIMSSFVISSSMSSYCLMLYVVVAFRLVCGNFVSFCKSPLHFF